MPKHEDIIEGKTFASSSIKREGKDVWPRERMRSLTAEPPMTHPIRAVPKLPPKSLRVAPESDPRWREGTGVVHVPKQALAH